MRIANLKMIIAKLFIVLLVVGFLTGEFSMAGEILTKKEKSIVMISSYTAAGDLN